MQWKLNFISRSVCICLPSCSLVVIVLLGFLNCYGTNAWLEKYLAVLSSSHSSAATCNAACKFANNMTIAVPTVYRRENYLATTLANLFAALDFAVENANATFSKINLVLGSRNTNNVKYYRHLSDIYKLNMASAQSYRAIAANPIRVRHSWNYLRALETLESGKQGILILEDDVITRQDMFIRLYSTLHEIQNTTRLGAVVINCYVRHRSVEWNEGPRGVTFYRSLMFDSSQCLFFTPKAVSIYKKALQIHVNKKENRPHEALLQGLDRANRLFIFNMRDPLVQHIGKRGTGLGHRFHKGEWRISI
jgi:hypothetical protein